MENTIEEECQPEDDMIYDFSTPPPWYISIALGIQHFLTMCTGNALMTIMVSNFLCLQPDSTVKSELISKSFFVMGISSFLQTIFGCKLPIIQGASFASIIPSIKLLTMPDMISCNISDNRMFQEMFLESNSSETISSMKIRILNSAIMIGSTAEFIIAISGILSVLTNLITPLSLAAIYTVLSLIISDSLLQMMAKQWAISIIGIIVTIVIVVVLSQVSITVPIGRTLGKWKFRKMKIFRICPIIIAIGLLWILASILTVSGCFSADRNGWGYAARTDVKFKAFYNSKIIKFPLPVQLSRSLLIPSAIIGIITGIVISVIESVGDYLLTSTVCKAPKIPQFAINRGIFIEGIGVFLSGALGSVVFPTSYSENIGVIKMTKAGNVAITRVSALLMIFCGIFPIFGAIFVSIPDPVVGSVFSVVCLLVLGCAINNFQYVDISSTRNIIVYGFSVSFGLYFPQWCASNLDLLSVGYKPIDEIIQIVLTIPLFIVAVTAIVLDNILPGKFYKETEFDIQDDNKSHDEQNFQNDSVLKRYLAYDTKIFKWIAIKFPVVQFLPLFPAYRHYENQIEICQNSVSDNSRL